MVIGVLVFGVFFTPNEYRDNTDNTLLIEERLVWRPIMESENESECEI
jgi:hypothetical protein